MGRISVELLEGGQVRCGALGIPLGLTGILGFLRTAEMQFVRQWEAQQQGPGIEVAPPGMTVLRNGG